MNATLSVQNYLSFHVGPQWYGIQLTEVIQIQHMLMLTELPGMTSDMLGLMTLGDMVVPVIDLRIRFGVAQPEYKLNTPIITVRTPRGLAGLMVDDADTVENVPEVEIVTYQGAEFPYVRGVARLPRGLLLLLDINRLTAEIQIPV
jgi:purine-binding chemotaxis protein CheW